MRHQHLSKSKNAIPPSGEAIAPPQTQTARHSPHPVEELQGLIGNRAVNQLLAGEPLVQTKPLFRGLSHELAIQPKLTIGAAGDKYEQEADNIASQVVRKIHGHQNQAIQREEMPENDEELQMQPTLQRFAQGNNGIAAPSNLESSINQAKGSGESIPPSIRQPMENAFGADFSGVKVHTDDRSHQLNRSIQSKAFTTGRDIFFRQGEYNPSSQEGQSLIAHELTHVLQQQRRKPDRAEGILQRRVLTIGDAEKEQHVKDEEADSEGSAFLDDEEQQVKTENAKTKTEEEFYTIPDKWGDRSLAHHYNYFHAKRRTARERGTYRFGPRHSFHPRWKNKYLKFMGKEEDLKIIAHGSGEKMGGYTPVKLVRLLIALGLQPKHKGIIWLRGCLAAYRPKRRFFSEVGTSFIEKMDRELRPQGYTNPIYGLRHIAMLGTLEEEYNPEKYEEKLPLGKRARIWYKANPYSPVNNKVKDEW